MTFNSIADIDLKNSPDRVSLSSPHSKPGSKCKRHIMRQKYEASHFEDLKEPASILIALPSVRRLKPRTKTEIFSEAHHSAYNPPQLPNTEYSTEVVEPYAPNLSKSYTSIGAKTQLNPLRYFTDFKSPPKNRKLGQTRYRIETIGNKSFGSSSRNGSTYLDSHYPLQRCNKTISTSMNNLRLHLRKLAKGTNTRDIGLGNMERERGHHDYLAVPSGKQQSRVPGSILYLDFFLV